MLCLGPLAPTGGSDGQGEISEDAYNSLREKYGGEE